MRVPRIDHVAVETDDPRATAEFYERIFGARIVAAEGHPVMAYVGNTGFAFHDKDGPGGHTAVRVTDEERDHDIAVGVFFEDPDGRHLEAITYRSGDDPRRP